jgi:caffeoyl-CoA O-methyltransferase
MSDRQVVGYTGEESLEEYISAHIEPESSLLYNLYRETNLHLLNPRMASGHIQGRLLKMLVSMIRPRTVLEIGTFTGYATFCMAEGLPEDGVIHTIEIDDELESFIEKWIKKSQFIGKIRLHIGDSLEIVPTLNLKFDLIFLDGEKRQYVNYYERFFDFLNPGGYMIADNTLWDGHVVDPAYDKDEQTVAIKAFNDRVCSDKRVEVSIIPLRDGLSIIRKL